MRKLLLPVALVAIAIPAMAQQPDRPANRDANTPAGTLRTVRPTRALLLPGLTASQKVKQDLESSHTASPTLAGSKKTAMASGVVQPRKLANPSK